MKLPLGPRLVTDYLSGERYEVVNKGIIHFDDKVNVAIGVFGVDFETFSKFL